MTPQEAIDLIVQVTDRFLGTKKDHETLNMAIDVLKQAVVPKTQDKA